MEQHEQLDDVRTQLKFFEQLDQMEKQRKEEQEREILLKAAKVTSSWRRGEINRPHFLLSLHIFFAVGLGKVAVPAKKNKCINRNALNIVSVVIICNLFPTAVAVAAGGPRAASA